MKGEAYRDNFVFDRLDKLCTLDSSVGRWPQRLKPTCWYKLHFKARLCNIC